MFVLWACEGIDVRSRHSIKELPMHLPKKNERSPQPTFKEPNIYEPHLTWIFQFTHMPAKCKCVFYWLMSVTHTEVQHFFPSFISNNCSNPPKTKKKTSSSWPFFPHPPNFVKLDHFPKVGMNIKTLWNHHSRELSLSTSNTISPTLQPWIPYSPYQMDSSTKWRIFQIQLLTAAADLLHGEAGAFDLKGLELQVSSELLGSPKDVMEMLGPLKKKTGWVYLWLMIETYPPPKKKVCSCLIFFVDSSNVFGGGLVGKAAHQLLKKLVLNYNGIYIYIHLYYLKSSKYGVVMSSPLMDDHYFNYLSWRSTAKCWTCLFNHS